jgi:hypothetical protein
VQAIIIPVVIVKRQIKNERPIQVQQVMAHSKNYSHCKHVSENGKRLTFLYYESRKQIGRSRPKQV